MKGQKGFTATELVAVLAIFALMSTLALVVGVGFVRGSRISKWAARFVDSASLARDRAVAGYEQWRVVFPAPPPGIDVVTSYTVESCRVAAGVSGAPGDPCPGPWVVREQVTLDPEDRVALKVPLVFGSPEVLYFDRTGQFLNDTTMIRVCHVILVNGTPVCRPGSTGRLIRIRKYSGIIET